MYPCVLGSIYFLTQVELVTGTVVYDLHLLRGSQPILLIILTDFQDHPDDGLQGS
jgi:hypothetical protein